MLNGRGGFRRLSAKLQVAREVGETFQEAFLKQNGSFRESVRGICYAPAWNYLRRMFMKMKLKTC